MEIKSWVNEMGRGWYYNKYNKNEFPCQENSIPMRKPSGEKCFPDGFL